MNKKPILLLGVVLVVVAGFLITKKLHDKSPAQNFLAAYSQDPSPEVKVPVQKNTNTGISNTDCAYDFDCYEKYYKDIVNKNGIDAAFTKLKEDYNKSPYVVAQCHQFTHVIGREAATIYPNVSDAYVHGDSFCWSGYYHGVMEGVAKRMGEENFLNNLNNICNDVEGKANYSFDYFNCVHGIGHGLMDLTENDLPDSLAKCDRFDGAWEENSCYGGVFMENIMVDNRNHFTKYLKQDDLLYPCDAVANKYKQQCYLMQTSYVLKANGGDFKAAFELCSKAGGIFPLTCYQSLGRDSSSRNNYSNPGMRATCMLGPNFEAQSNCIVGAVKDVISYFHSDKQANDLCSLLDPTLQPICTSTATDYYKSF